MPHQRMFLESFVDLWRAAFDQRWWCFVIGVLVGATATMMALAYLVAV